MAHNTGAKGNARNIGLHGGPGKGDADRTTSRKQFNANFDEIFWLTGEEVEGWEFVPRGFVRKALNKWTKRYS